MGIRTDNLKVWPHLTVVFLIFAALGVGAAALWMRHEPAAEALALPSAARVERVDGQVGLGRVLEGDAEDARWIEVTPNTPLTVGDRLYAREDSQASLAFTGRNFARLDPGSALDVISLDGRRTQLALHDGSAVFNIGELAPGELFEVATPYGAVDFRQPGLYEVGYNDDGSAFVSVLSGLAQVVGLAGSGQIGKGEMLTLLGQTAAQIALSRLSPDYAGGLVDDYYGYQYPQLYDGRYRDYDAYLSDPYYYDPYNRYQSYRYVPSYVPGAHDLDYYGDWQDLNGYGPAWSPRADAGWAPYRQGHWMMDDPHGLTWVSSEPWGYAPYHYGRWINEGGRWFWLPEASQTRTAYSPALVAFLPLTEANQIGWIPLAPGDPYVPAYYDANWQPHYADAYVQPERIVNLNAPGGLTVVSADEFYRPLDAVEFERVDPRAFERVRPVGDPLSVAMLRQAALRTANARRGFDLPPGLAKRLDAARVYTSAQPSAPPFAGGRVRGRRVEAVPEKVKREKLQFRDERQVFAAQEGREGRRLEQQLRRQQREQERAARRQESGAQAVPQFGTQGPPARVELDRDARRAEYERAARGAESEKAARRVERQADSQQARGERVGLTRQADREAARRQAWDARQQQRAAEQQQRAAQQQQRAAEQQQRGLARQQQEARRQAQQQAAQQRAAQHAAQRQAAQQQHLERVRAEQQQRQQQHQQQQQRRAERQQSRPQPPAQASPGQTRRQQSAPQAQARPAGPPQSGGNHPGHGKGGGKGKKP